MDTPNNRKPTLQKIPIYEVRLVQSGRPLRLAEATVSDGELAARTMHAMIGLTDREHFAALFLNGAHRVTGAHVVAIGGQHGITNIEVRTVFRAAITACASAVVSGNPMPSTEDIATTAKLMTAGRILGVLGGRPHHSDSGFEALALDALARNAPRRGVSASCPLPGFLLGASAAVSCGATCDDDQCCHSRVHIDSSSGG
jgi:hypothetical protein